MYLFVLKKTLAERSPRRLWRAVSPALRMDVSRSTQANVKSGTVCEERCTLTWNTVLKCTFLVENCMSFLTAACVSWLVCSTLMTENWLIWRKWWKYRNKLFPCGFLWLIWRNLAWIFKKKCLQYYKISRVWLVWGKLQMTGCLSEVCVTLAFWQMCSFSQGKSTHGCSYTVKNHQSAMLNMYNELFYDIVFKIYSLLLLA